jgi:hypothetical protein
MLPLTQIAYLGLSPKQQEAYNILKLRAVLADYGFLTKKAADDAQLADFIAVHLDGKTTLTVQVLGRLKVAKRYVGVGLCIAFPDVDGGRNWYLGLHDELLARVLEISNIEKTRSWIEDGEYHFHPPLSQPVRQLIEPYKIGTEPNGTAP